MGTTPNRGYVYPDEGVDGWFNTFVAMMDAIDSDVQSFINANPITDITIIKSTPAVRFQGTEVGAVEFRIVESAGTLLVQKNTGTASAPTWVSIAGFTSAGDVVTYVAGKGYAVSTPDGSSTVRMGVDNDGALKETSYP